MSIKIALMGNPNCGKTTFFNALTGSNQYVGNWPGVTVEKKEGKIKGYEDVVITDLPGIYSLSPYTAEEIVARDYLINEKPNVILNIIDGTNPERNLYLTTQILELGIPVVVAVNMMDIVRKNGDKFNITKLGELLGCKVFEVSALKGIGITQVADACVEAVHMPILLNPIKYSNSIEQILTEINSEFFVGKNIYFNRWYSVKIFENDSNVMEKANETLTDAINKKIALIEKEFDDDAESIITNERYNHITSIIDEVYIKNKKNKSSISDRIDNIVTGRFTGLPVFAGVMVAVYFFAMKSGAFFSKWVSDVLFGEWLIKSIEILLKGKIAEWLYSLVCNGILVGVGAVLSFVPQMVVLFICLALLEECGYMSRIAFVMDRLFCKFGLSGKSFISILIGTGCGVPAIMASRTIESERERRMTILTTTFIPCSAKLPMIALITGVCFGGSAWAAASAYFVGIGAIIISGIMLKKTKLFSGAPAPFVMELPPYHIPSVESVVHSTIQRTWAFIKKAGTIIALGTIVIWFLQAFSLDGGIHLCNDMEKSILADIGNIICKLFVPLGWGGWKPAVATITGLIAKENIVGTFGIVYNLGNEMSNAGGLYKNLIDNFNELSAGHPTGACLGFMIFNLLCAPCIAAVSTILREMNSIKWSAFAIGYQCTFAYCISLVTYQLFRAVEGDASLPELTVAIAIVLVICYLLFRKNKYEVR